MIRAARIMLAVVFVLVTGSPPVAGAHPEPPPDPSSQPDHWPPLQGQPQPPPMLKSMMEARTPVDAGEHAELKVLARTGRDNKRAIYPTGPIIWTLYAGPEVLRKHNGETRCYISKVKWWSKGHCHFSFEIRSNYGDWILYKGKAEYVNRFDDALWQMGVYPFVFELWKPIRSRRAEQSGPNATAATAPTMPDQVRFEAQEASEERFQAWNASGQPPATQIKGLACSANLYKVRGPEEWRCHARLRIPGCSPLRFRFRVLLHGSDGPATHTAPRDRRWKCGA